ncbi:Sfum_1244 family protein [Desulfopila sp. IMCC35008]|uniref:Sfum_1244 family protein n=1 Tax=Desulfopila sp. IMCC35008 TaxID=2653858 RepID=UPI0013D0BCD1|nr:Sfum_1244 family protein [Desulfopila sp. IMCC35008]
MQNFLDDIRYNCDISDARDHGVYSMCTMVLKLRNFYKWEKGIEPWDEPEPAELLDWIEAKENYWETLAGGEYRELRVGETSIEPFELEKVNTFFQEEGWYYGAGFGRSMKTIFFLAEIIEHREVEGCPVIILGKEHVREMAAPPAMVQDQMIIIKRDAIRFFFWDQIEEFRSSCRNPLQRALETYGLYRKNKLDRDLLCGQLETIVDHELNLFVYHEVGEILQKGISSSTLQKITGHFPGSIPEFICRGIKDLLADTHPQGPLAYAIREQRLSTLGFYLTFLDGLREKIFPELAEGWKRFNNDHDWSTIESARGQCYEKMLSIASKIESIAEEIGHKSDADLLKMFENHILQPLYIPGR